MEGASSLAPGRDKFDMSFEAEAEFWRLASETLSDQAYYEQLVAAEVMDIPFTEQQEENIDKFETFQALFQKGDKFWALAKQNLKEEEFERLVEIYIVSDQVLCLTLNLYVYLYLAALQITWDSLTSDVFLTKPANFPCSTCSQTFPTEVELSVHTATQHEDKPFVCDLCPKAFKMARELRIHKDFNHSEDKPLSCNYCSRHFKQFDALQKHRYIHTTVGL